MLTDEDLAKDREQRARLEPLAMKLGVVLDPDDRRLVNALECVASVLERKDIECSGAYRSTPRASTGSNKSAGAAPANLTTRDQAVEILYAERQGRAPAEWATRPLPSKGR